MSSTYTAPSTPLAKITRDHDTQSRVRLDSDVVAEYAAAMAEGVLAKGDFDFFDDDDDDGALADGGPDDDEDDFEDEDSSDDL